MRDERGSLSILMAGYLALAILLGISMGAVGLSLVAKNRIQGVADSALLYAHDRAVRKGIPSPVKIRVGVEEFLDNAPSAKELEIAQVQTSVAGVESQLTLCARHKDPLEVFRVPALICRTATAKSFRND